MKEISNRLDKPDLRKYARKGKKNETTTAAPPSKLPPSTSNPPLSPGKIDNLPMALGGNLLEHVLNIPYLTLLFMIPISII